MDPRLDPKLCLRSTHVGRGVVQHSLRGHIDLPLEKHGSEPGGQLEQGLTSLK